jgi:membrane fusion protein, copper/silver efflux system
MKMKKIFSNRYFLYGSLVICGIFLGWLFFHSPRKTIIQNINTPEEKQETIWTCAMHPEIRMHEPGKCPICAMDLTPLNQRNVTIDSTAVYLSEEAVQLANVQTSVVSIQKPVMEVRMYGKVQTDERLLQSQVAHISGRIEKLLVNFTGEAVQKGQTLAIIYSPEIITAQQELLEASKTKQGQPEIYEAARERLRQWRLSESQINFIENSGNIQNNVEIVSDISGIITAKRVNNGDYITQGTILFDVADLSRVWVLFDAYESDLQFLRKGDNLEFTAQALPGVKFAGNISFIDPVIDAVNRVAKVRIETSNQSGRLKPEMFVTGIVKARLDEYRNMLVIPKSAVLWTGTRSIVYVKESDNGEPFFKIREVGLGPMLGNSYVITDGLTEGEEIVTQGAFSVDASAQLEGKPSMMNPGGGSTSSMPGMDMPGGKTISSNPSGIEQAKPDDTKKLAKSKVSMDFVMQLNTVFDKYIELKDAFVQSDVKKAKQTAGVMEQSLADIDMNLLTGDEHTQWMNSTNKINNLLKHIQVLDEIEGQRKDFSDLSSAFYKVIKNFGLMGKTAYYQICPMAFNEKGAYWLSTTQKISNPYFGDQMLTCGENRETLSY